MRRITFLLLLVPLFSATILFADEKPEDTTDKNPSYQITITADRLEESVTQTSDSVSVITRDEIETHQWHYVLDALRQVPGVSIVQSGSPGKVTSLFLRGAGSAQVLVFIDGIPINNPYFGGISFEDLTTDNVERIEVLKGPQSPLYGSDSIGGVIQIISRKGQQGNQIHAGFEAGSFQTFREKAGISGAQDAFDYALTFSRQDSDGQTSNDAFNENVISGRGGIRLSDRTNLSFTGQMYDSEIGIPFHFVFDPILFATVIEASPLQRGTSNLALIGTGLQHTSGAYLNLNASFAYTRRDFHSEDPGTFFAASDNKSDVFQLTLQNDFQLGAGNTLSAGYEYEHQKIEAQDSSNGSYPLKSVDDNALFVQDKLESGPWILTAGVRWDHYNTFGDTTNPRVSVAYKLQEEWKVRGSYGRGFRAPSAGDLGLPFFGNPDLKPEQSESWEVGTDYYHHNSDFSASYFHNAYDDLITFDPATFIAGNVANAKAQGLELAYSTSYGNWRFGAGYMFLDTEDEATGLQLPRRPKHSGSFQVAYKTSRWEASLNLNSIGDRLESDFLAFPPADVFNPGYTKLDLAGRYELLSWLKLKGRIENLTDAEYEEVLFYKAPGIGFYGGFDVEW